MSNELSSDVKTFIVQSLACFDPPSRVVKAVKEEFGIAVTRQAVHHYDAERKGGEQIGQEWRELFERTRKKFLEQIVSIGIAHRAVRLRKLDRLVARAEEVGNHGMVIAACEAAAKETGGMYTNRRRHELSGTNGKDLPASGPGVVVVLPDNGRDLRSRTTQELEELYRVAATSTSTPASNHE